MIREIASAFTGADIKLVYFFYSRLCIDEEPPSTNRIIAQYHGKQCAHWGVKATVRAMQGDGHSWEDMRADVSRFIRNCDNFFFLQVIKSLKLIYKLLCYSG